MKRRIRKGPRPKITSILNEELTINAGLLCGQLLLPFTTCLAMLDATADAEEDMLSEYLCE